MNIAADVANGLEFLHRRGVVLRDLKAANILVRNAHYADLSDLDVKMWWLVCPVVCKLAVFGE